MASTDLADDSPPGAAYGLACEACARAKCKCVQLLSTEAGHRCERCDRLGKICQPAKSKRHLKVDSTRNSRVEKSRTDDVSRLERKLDQLVAHLKVPQQNLASPSSSDASGLIPSAAHSDHISPIEAEESFARFKRCNARFFPFLSLPRTAQELQRDRPILLTCITAVASRRRSKQNDRMAHVQETLSSRITGRAEASIDLLLAVLCYLGWAHMQGKHPVTIKATITIFTQIAVALVYDLGLNKEVAKDPPQMTCIPPLHMRPPQRPPRTMEERRAVLGTFVLVSALSTTLKRADSMRWSSHMQDCLLQIEAHQQDPLDKILAQIVRIQLIADKALKSTSNDANMGVDGTPHPPPSLFAQEMLHQLVTLKTTMLDTVAQDVTVQLHFHAAEIAINEVALYGDPTNVRGANIHRTRHLYGCTQAIKAWCEVFFTIPVPDVNGIVTLNLMQMRHIMGLLYILSNIDEPGWSREDACAIIDLYTLLDRLADLFSQVPAAVDFRGDIDTVSYDDHWWTHVASTVRTLRTIWAGQDRQANAVTGATSAVPMGDAVDLEGTDFDIPGLDWLMDPAMMTYTM